MIRNKTQIFKVFGLFTTFILLFCLFVRGKTIPAHRIGQVVDRFDGVAVYYNGKTSNVWGRHLTKDGYNLGLKYQCVEFVKRYYYQRYRHKMPNSYGHAKDFFNPHIFDGGSNSGRALHQYTNPSFSKPKVGDLVVFKATYFSPYGHVAIVSKVSKNKIQIVQQNSGRLVQSRLWLGLQKVGKRWKIKHYRIVGWLRKR